MEILSLRNYCILSCLVLIGCGSEGGAGGTPTDTSIQFSLFPSNYFSSFNRTFNTTGSGTTGDSYTFTLTETTQPQTTFMGIPAIPLQRAGLFTNTSSGASVSYTDTIYFSTNASDRHFLGYSGDTTTVSATTTAIPETATIGSSGSIGTYTDNLGDVEIASWRLEDGFDGRAEMVFEFEYRDQFNNLDGRETTAYLINPDGSIVSVSSELIFSGSGIKVTLSGS